MFDRISLYPGRVTLTPVSGQTNTYDMERADSPTQEGTPLNKANLLTDAVAAQFGLDGVVPNDIFAWLGKYNEHWWSLLQENETTYEHSTDRNAYPDSGTVDGITYSYLGVPFEKFPTMPQIATGSYTGTGTYGASNPNSLTFEFAPTIVLLYGTSSTGYYVATPYNSWQQLSGAMYNYLVDMRVIATEYTRTNGFGYYGNSNQYGKRSQDGKTISWYVTDSASYQLNASGVTYYYLALG